MGWCFGSCPGGASILFPYPTSGGGLSGAVTPPWCYRRSCRRSCAAENVPPYSKCCIYKSKTDLRFNSTFKNNPKNISIMRTDTIIMANKVSSVIKGCISHIQLKLSDFLKGDPDPGKIITGWFTERTQPHNINNFDLVNPVCPLCGSNRMTKQEYYGRNPILGEFGSQKIYLKGICVKSAGKKFITPFDSVVDPKNRYAPVFKDGAFKLIGDDVYDILKLEETLYGDKIGLCVYFTDIKNVFRVYDEEIATEMFETLIDDFDVIPSVLQKCIRKKIIPDFDMLTGVYARWFDRTDKQSVWQLLFDLTDPGGIKHKYRTPRGILAYLARKLEYWTAKFGPVLEHHVM